MQGELNTCINGLKSRLQHLYLFLNINSKQEAVSQIESEMLVSNFWSDKSQANKKVTLLKALKDALRRWSDCREKLKELDELLRVASEDDQPLIAEIRGELDKLDDELKLLEFRMFFSGRFDRNNAIVSINAGAGGTESCDWVAMLYRMYTRWAQNKGFTARMLDILEGEEAGVKNVTFSIRGEYSFGHMRSEKGVHRLVRISPFDANKRRHTSFASVDVMPEIQDDIEIQINPADLRIDRYRSSGAGGQHVNVTDSAVRITHLPTNIVVQCQNERSQHQNKISALKILRARLYEKLEKEKEQEMTSEHAKKKRIEWGSQIRSYVMQPYSLVKDHRTDYQTGNVNAVLNGELDKFMESFLKWRVEKGK